MSAPQPAMSVTLVHAPACHLCADAQDALAELARDHPLSVDLVAAEAPRGVALLQAHRAPMLPLVLVDGALFSWGRLPRRKLRRRLEATAAAGVR